MKKNLYSQLNVDYVTTDVTTDSLYYYSSTPNTIWPLHIYQSSSNIPSQSVCSAMCTLTSVNCQIYVHAPSSLTCYLGSFVVPAAVSAVAVKQGGTELMHTRISAIGKIMLGIKTSNFTSVFLVLFKLFYGGLN